MSVELSFQTALLDHLRSDDGVSEVLGERIFDQAQSGVRYPYLYLGRSEVEPQPASEVDVSILRQTVLIRGRRNDQDAIKQACSAIRTALLARSLRLPPPYTAPLARVVYSDVFSNTDSRILQGLVRVQALISNEI